MKISVIIPNYNGLEILKSNLTKIIDVLKNTRIIIVDDASTDGSADYIKKNYPDVKLLENRSNRGYSFTVNRGVEESEGELVLLLNTDVVPEKGIIDKLKKHFEDPSVFAVGCLEKSVEGNSVVERGRGIGKFHNGFLNHQRGETDKDDTLWVSGGSGMFRKDIWDSLGKMDEIYSPFYWEDIDLSYRALKCGFKLVFDKKSIVYHYHVKGSIISNYADSYIKAISYRNQIIFVWLNITDTAFTLQHFLYLPYHLISALISGNWTFLKGFLLAFFMINTVMKKRFLRKKMWKESDVKVLHQFNMVK